MFRLSFIILFFSSFLIAAAITETEPNDNCAQADAITIFDTGTGIVAENDDPNDYWVFTTPSSAGNLRIYTTGYINNTDSDGYLYLSTNCTNYLIRDYRTNPDVDLTYNVTKNTTYYFRMNAYNRNNNPYVLNFTFTSNNHAPTITAPNSGNAYPLSVPENTTAVTDINANDSDNDTLTYTLSGTDASRFTINASTGVITFATTPDYEAPADAGANNVYNITITVTDSGYPAMSDTQNITVTVTNVNDIPIIIDPNNGNNYALSIPENTSSVTDVNATDPENQTLTYSLSGVDASNFTIDSSTGIITFATTPDYENPTDNNQDNIYSITVTVSDGSLIDDQNITLTITNVNDNPIAITDSNSSTNSVPENASIGTPVGITVSASDADTGATITSYRLTDTSNERFAIDPTTHIITVDGALDYDTAISHTIMVEVNSSDGSSATQSFTINLTDVEEFPMVNYRFDECQWNEASGGIKDSSDNHLDGIAVNGASIDTNTFIINNSAILNDNTITTQYIEIPDNDLLDDSNKLTIMGWINPSTYTPVNGNALGVFSKRTSSSSEYSYGALLGYAFGSCTSDKLVIDIDGTNNRFCTNSSIPLNQWTHFAIVYNGTLSDSTRVKVYLNGALDTTATENSSTLPNSIAPLRIGSLYDSASNPKPFKGNIDEFKIYRFALNQSKIQEIISFEQNKFNFDGTPREASCCCVPTGGNLIANPSFETLCASTIVTSYPGTAGGNAYLRNGLCGWQIAHFIETWENTTSPTASNGTVFTEIDGNSGQVDKIWQNLNTVPNTNYVISFDYRKRDTAHNDIIIAKWNDVAITQVEGITTAWQTAQIQVTGGSTGLDKLSFEEPSPDDGYGSFIDNIRVAEGTLSTPKNYGFDAWDSFRSISDRNISTKIVNKPFTLTVAALNEANTAYQEFNGTVCAKIINNADQNISGWNKLLFNDQNSSTTTFTINRAIGGSDSARVKLYWKKNVDTTCPLTAEDNTSIASDRFSVRPSSFAVTTTNAVAGVDFNITLTAPIYGATTASSDYNESAGGTFDVAIAEHNASCATGTFSPTPTSFSFLNGSKTLTTRYSEVGILDLNITDTSKTCASRYTLVDCDDANVSDGTNFTADLLPIGLTQKSITITPHHFDVNATLSNFDGGTFTYLSNDLNMSAQLDLNITAKNGEGNTTTNYTSGCYSKDTTVTLPHSTVPSSLSKILYHDSITLADTNITKASSITSTYDASKFIQGIVTPRITLNFDRNSSTPLNPFDFNITSATATDADSVTGTTTPLGDTTFVYGRVHAYDIKTDQISILNPIEIEIYAKNSNHSILNGKPQNVLNWYRNTDHNDILGGVILSGDDYPTSTKIGVSTTIMIDPTPTPENGIHPINIINNDKITDKKYIHLTIPLWLWNSITSYSDLTNSKCTQHPCFQYHFTDSSMGVNGVNSGTFQGSDFQMAPAKNITNKGVKLFR